LRASARADISSLSNICPRDSQLEPAKWLALLLMTANHVALAMPEPWN
jgi:hypothetical protein